MGGMVDVVRLAPLLLQSRREAREAELKRVFGTDVRLIEVADMAEFRSTLTSPDVVAVALDAPAPGQLDEAVAAAGSRPVLRPLWRKRRNNRGEVDDLFDGYGLLTDTGVLRLADGELAPD